MNTSLKSLIRRVLPGQLRAHRVWSGFNRRKRLVTSWHDYPAAIVGYSEAPLLEWLDSHVQPGETWLDIGAHYGNIALLLCERVGPTGRVFAFEPNLASAGCLARTRRLNRLSQLLIVPFGLCAEDSFNVVHMPETRGMIDSTLCPAAGAFAESILTSSLHCLWPAISQGNPQIDGVKIDVQGMELEVLRGMISLLRTHRPRLVVEVHSGVDRNELRRLLELANYRNQCASIEPDTATTAGNLCDNRSYVFLPH